MIMSLLQPQRWPGLWCNAALTHCHTVSSSRIFITLNFCHSEAHWGKRNSISTLWSLRSRTSFFNTALGLTLFHILLMQGSEWRWSHPRDGVTWPLVSWGRCQHLASVSLMFILSSLTAASACPLLSSGCCQMSRLCSPSLVTELWSGLWSQWSPGCWRLLITWIMARTRQQLRTGPGHRSQLRLPVSSQTAAVTSCHSCRARLLLSQSELHFSSLTTIHRYTPLQFLSLWGRDFTLKGVRNFRSGDTLGCVHLYKHSFSIILSNITVHICINSQSIFL